MCRDRVRPQRRVTAAALLTPLAANAQPAQPAPPKVEMVTVPRATVEALMEVMKAIGILHPELVTPATQHGEDGR